MSEIERYLDELFDRLAGTGAAGRRALAEAEDHLRTTAAAAAAGRGMAPEKAEHDAVTSFGPSGLIARQFRRAQGRNWASSVSGGWLLAGLAVVTLGLSLMVTAAQYAVLIHLHPEHMRACSPDFGPAFNNGVCSTSVPAARAAAVSGLVVTLAGAILLAGREVARLAGLGPASRRLPLLAAAGFGAGGPIFTVISAGWLAAVYGETSGITLINEGPGIIGFPEITGMMMVLCAVVLMAWGGIEARRPPS